MFINEKKLTDYDLDYSNINDEDKNNLIKGSILSSTTGDLSLLKSFFESVLKENVKKNTV